MVAAGNDSAIIEATSHGLALGRTRNCRFDIGVVTTVTSEHLEFHGTLEAYRAAKALLIEEAPVAVLNADDPAFGYFRERAAGRVLSYAIEADADLRATRLEADATGTRFHLASPRWSGSVTVAMPGRFNVSNALAVLGIGEALGVDLDRAGAALADTSGVPGRMERIDAGQPFTVIVDYAHTADSLGQVLAMLRAVTTGRLIVVFGSAGERDPTKRAPMVGVAATSADFVIVTDEDPRLEDPRDINEQIAGGARAAGAADGERLWVIDDGRDAIARADRAWPATATSSCWPARATRTRIFYGTEKRAWDDRRWRARSSRPPGGGTPSGPSCAPGGSRTRRVERASWRRPPITRFPSCGSGASSGPRRGLEARAHRDRTYTRGAGSPGSSSCCDRSRSLAGTSPMRRAGRWAGSTNHRCATRWWLPCGRSATPSASRRCAPIPRSASAHRSSRPSSQPPWHPAAKVQPPITRVIDLTAGEDALRAALRRKHRQYVNKAERDGVTIERFDGSAAPDVIGPGPRRLQPDLSAHREPRRVRGA